jgi:hypothetical protein
MILRQEVGSVYPNSTLGIHRLERIVVHYGRDIRTVLQVDQWDNCNNEPTRLCWSERQVKSLS